jgi:hypothetical protein
MYRSKLDKLLSVYVIVILALFSCLKESDAVPGKTIQVDRRPNVIINVRPFRGGKFSNYEGGHRVPAVARWPGHIKAGWTSDELIVGMDLLPTVMDIAHIDISKLRQFDGMSVKGPIEKWKLDMAQKN